MWRSLWVLQDVYLYPENSTISAIACLAYGVVIYVVFYVSNKHVNMFLVKSPNLMVARFVMVFGFTGVVSTWRGLWMLQFEYTYPTNSSDNMKIIICLISLMVASILFLFTNRMSSTLSRSCCKDDAFFVKKRFIVITSFSKFLKPKPVS
jgi:hypothetical protein